MKTSDLSVKELATFIGVSTDTIRRAVRREEIPARRVRTALRFRNLKEAGVYVDSETEGCLGHLLDVDHSRQILQICVACDDLSLLVLGSCIHNRVGHCQAVAQA